MIHHANHALRFAASLTVLVFVSACADAAPSPPTDPATDGLLAAVEGQEPEGEGPARPTRCDSDQSCDGKCPKGAKGCKCAATPFGEKVCAPSCSADADCPQVPGVPQLRCDQGVCAPPAPPPKGQACGSDADCPSECVPGASKCTCRETPQDGKACVPACSVDADCPKAPAGAPAARCEQGACRPPAPRG